MRTKTIEIKATITNEETDKAAARGALFALENWTWIIFAIIRPSVPPTNLGVM